MEEVLQKQEAALNQLKGIHQNTRDCLRREDLKNLNAISAADECSDKVVNFTCICPPGFVLNGLRCEDVDECARGKADCSPHATCKNSLGSYSCSCNPPFQGDGRTCDVDECAQGIDDCSPLASCKNSVGSYSCSCNPPFEGDGRTCEFFCRRPAKAIEGLGCVKLVGGRTTWEETRDLCHREGWRLLQDFDLNRLQDVRQAFQYYGPWIGVHNGKWTETSGAALGEELWVQGYRSDPSKRCGLIIWDLTSSSFKVTQGDCSVGRYGFCQVI
ncbi:protein kinase C-binding protein NELL2a-like isoform X2 [Macrobrachium rosenbergii]|uniref:protein kinase C-binding protein NELL2a-like isoform X2 n=1 Tax=Macrobrachium rosenbergii TaxID=79674 RepID=UPI0034D677F7